MSTPKLIARVRWGETTLDAVVSETRRVPLAADLAGAADLWLTSPDARGALLHVPAGARAARSRDGAVDPLAPGDHALARGESATVVFGALTFDLGWTSAAAPLGRDGALEADFVRVLGMTAVMHGVLVAAALGTPGKSAIDGGLQKHGARWINVLLTPRAERPKPTPKKPALEARPRGPEGMIGRRDRPPAKGAAPKDVKQLGLLAYLDGPRGVAGASVFARGGLSDGLAHAMAGLDGVGVADAGGLGGLGARGLDRGGGGGAVDIGGFGRGRHGGDGDIDLGRGGGPRGPTVSGGRRIEVVNISKEEIGRVIRRNLSRFKYCYERELAADPNLSGKVSVRFTIAPTGKVAEATVDESTLGQATVEACVLDVMRSLPFPAPKGGGVAVVTYPFVFASAGG